MHESESSHLAIDAATSALWPPDAAALPNVTSRVLRLLFLVGVLALCTTACQNRSEATPEPPEWMLFGGGGSDLAPSGLETGDLDCVDLVKPAAVGQETFERYDIEAKLLEGEFARQEDGGYITCSYSGPIQLRYLFDDETGELVLTTVEWEGSLHQTPPTPTPAPTRPELEELLGEDGDYLTVCFDADTPLIETEGEDPQQWGVWDLLGGAPCSIEISGPICWDCGEDLVWHWLIPVPGGEETGVTGGGRACINAATAVLITGQELDDDEAELVADGACNLQLGMGQVCWHCREAKALPSPEPTPQDVATPAPAPLCREVLTPEVTGQDAWDRYGIAELLKSDRFRRKLCTDSTCVICYADRMIGEALVQGDELYYRFDTGTRELVMERIHWREDLSDETPSPLVSQQEAEAMVEGEVQYSYLAFPGIEQLDLQVGKSASRRPCWYVSSRITDPTGFDIPRVTVIDALSGEILGHYPPS